MNKLIQVLLVLSLSACTHRIHVKHKDTPLRKASITSRQKRTITGWLNNAHPNIALSKYAYVVEHPCDHLKIVSVYFRGINHVRSTCYVVNGKQPTVMVLPIGEVGYTNNSPDAIMQFEWIRSVYKVGTPQDSSCFRNYITDKCDFYQRRLPQPVR